MTEHGDLILVVDDDPLVLRLASSVLGSAGFRVAVAEGGRAALELWEPLRSGIALVLSDVVMPGIDGPEMAHRMVEIDPGVKILFMSGYTDRQRDAEAGRRFPLIRKPFLPEDLVRKVRQAIGGTSTAVS